MIKTERVAGWMADPDVGLMQRVRGGDDAAFAELQSRYSSQVFGYFCRHLRDRGEAEDLTQEVFLRLYRSRLRYEPKARFATWLFHITQNVARNALRTRRRRPCLRLDATEPGNEQAWEGGGERHAEAPSRPLERDEVAGVVRAAVAELKGRSRTAVEMHQFQDRSYAEVAAELDMTPKAAKSLLYRAKSSLREVLQGYMG